MPTLRVIGLDLGQQKDFTALAMLECKLPTPPPHLPWLPNGQQPKPEPFKPVWRVPTLKRWPLGTSYLDIARGLGKFYQSPDVAGAIMAVDQTGVGRPVVEMIREELGRARAKDACAGITITGGHQVIHAQDGPGQWHVPKKTLVAVVQVLLGTRRLKIEPALSEAATLVRELEMFRVKVSALGQETLEAWRERDHDDLVLAVARAAWMGESWHGIAG
jgi:hypothetical protein